MFGPICLCTAALWFDVPVNYDFPFKHCFAGILASLFSFGSFSMLLFVRPLARSLGGVSLVLLVIVTWWFFIPPRNGRAWMQDVAIPATAVINGDLLIIHNLRNFDYKTETDFRENWETRAYDLVGLKGVDIFFCLWGPKRIAHTIASWEFADGKHLAISIETRKEKDEEYSAVRGFFRQFELYYVVADERDVIRLRTNFRGEQVLLYQTSFSPEQARLLLLDYLQEVNQLAKQPAWYNALTHNCTTNIRMHLKNINMAKRLDWRLLLNGYADQLSYERGILYQNMPFEDLRKHSDITKIAKKYDRDPAFSAHIRAEIPKIRQ
jgi:hypothetical protein